MQITFTDIEINYNVTELKRMINEAEISDLYDIVVLAYKQYDTLYITHKQVNQVLALAKKRGLTGASVHV